LLGTTVICSECSGRSCSSDGSGSYRVGFNVAVQGLFSTIEIVLCALKCGTDFLLGGLVVPGSSAHSSFVDLGTDLSSFTQITDVGVLGIATEMMCSS